MTKYEPLTTYLSFCKKQRVKLTYSEIEGILGFTLPQSSYKDLRWWLNNDKSHTQSKSWGKVGYIATEIILGNSVTFEKEVY